MRITNACVFAFFLNLHKLNFEACFCFVYCVCVRVCVTKGLPLSPDIIFFSKFNLKVLELQHDVKILYLLYCQFSHICLSSFSNRVTADSMDYQACLDQKETRYIINKIIIFLVKLLGTKRNEMLYIKFFCIWVFNYCCIRLHL